MSSEAQNHSLAVTNGSSGGRSWTKKVRESGRDTMRMRALKSCDRQTEIYGGLFCNVASRRTPAERQAANRTAGLASAKKRWGNRTQQQTTQEVVATMPVISTNDPSVARSLTLGPQGLTPTQMAWRKSKGLVVSE
jgi:hypothetical protein